METRKLVEAMIGVYLSDPTGDGGLEYLAGKAPNRGWVVGGVIPSFVIDGDAVTDSYTLMQLRQDLTDHVSRHMGDDPLAVDCVGYWNNGGEIHFYLSHIFPSESTAMRAAIERGELAVWSIHDGVSVYV